MINANQWYNILKTSTVPSSTGVRLEISLFQVEFIVTVDWGNAVITLVSSNVASTFLMALRLRSVGGVFFIDFKTDRSFDTSVNISLLNSNYWVVTTINTSVSGEILCLIDDISEYLPGEQMQECLLEIDENGYAYVKAGRTLRASNVLVDNNIVSLGEVSAQIASDKPVEGGVKDYSLLENKPKINGVTLEAGNNVFDFLTKEYAEENFLTTDNLSELLDGFATVDSVNELLNDYVTIIKVNKLLEDYATLDSLSSIDKDVSLLKGYFTNGSAKSALKLNDSADYKAWGQTFFTAGKPKTLSGNISNAGNITPDSSVTYDIGSTSLQWNNLYVKSAYINNADVNDYLRIKPSDKNYGSYLYFGDGSNAYISETSDNTLTIYAKSELLLNDVHIDAIGVATFNKQSIHNEGIKIGDATIVWDGVRECLVIDKNIVSIGEVSSNSSVEGVTTIEDDVTFKGDVIFDATVQMNTGCFITSVLQVGDINRATGATIYGNITGYLSSLILYNPLGTMFGTMSFLNDGFMNFSSSIRCVSLVQSSDENLKHKLEDVCLSSKIIAESPMFKFRWNNQNDNTIHIGTSAQYWKDHVPELTFLYSGLYSLDYSTLGVMMGHGNANDIQAILGRLGKIEEILNI